MQIVKDNLVEQSNSYLVLPSEKCKPVAKQDFFTKRGLQRLWLFYHSHDCHRLLHALKINPISLWWLFKGVITGAKLSFDSLKMAVSDYKCWCGRNYAIFNVSVVSFFSECAPSATFHVFFCNDEIRFAMSGLVGFMCRKYTLNPLRRCYNCSFCSVGTYYPAVDSHSNCFKCPAGNYLSFFIIICYCSFSFSTVFLRKTRRIVICVQVSLRKKSRLSPWKILLQLRWPKIHSFVPPLLHSFHKPAHKACEQGLRTFFSFLRIYWSQNKSNTH